MTEHPTELLLQIADGAVPPPEARAHLATCQRCQQTLAALAPLDLDYVWQGVTAELDAPKPSLLERLLVAVGVRPGLARFTATTPSLRLGWLLANALVLLLIALPMALRPVASWPPAMLLAAPLVAAAAVAFAYGPAVDPAYEAVAATPLSPLQALLVRLAAVLVANTALARRGRPGPGPRTARRLAAAHDRRLPAGGAGRLLLDTDGWFGRRDGRLAAGPGRLEGQPSAGGLAHRARCPGRLRGGRRGPARPADQAHDR
jgi:hypothetical protein